MPDVTDDEGNNEECATCGGRFYTLSGKSVCPPCRPKPARALARVRSHNSLGEGEKLQLGTLRGALLAQVEGEQLRIQRQRQCRADRRLALRLSESQSLFLAPGQRRFARCKSFEEEHEKKRAARIARRRRARRLTAAPGRQCAAHVVQDPVVPLAPENFVAQFKASALRTVLPATDIKNQTNDCIHMFLKLGKRTHFCPSLMCNGEQ